MALDHARLAGARAWCPVTQAPSEGVLGSRCLAVGLGHAKLLAPHARSRLNRLILAQDLKLVRPPSSPGSCARLTRGEGDASEAGECLVLLRLRLQLRLIRKKSDGRLGKQDALCVGVAAAVAPSGYPL